MDAPWTITARNLPEHARNPIHTDEGARAAGFERGLVAGVTTYAYCCHPVIDRFGLDVLRHGEIHVAFRSPVFDGDVVAFPVVDLDDGGIALAAVPDRTGKPHVEVSAWISIPNRYVARSGEVLEPLQVVLDAEYGSSYGIRAGDDDATCVAAEVVHPAVWPALANNVFHAQLVHGSWIHTRSIVRHHALVPVGVEAVVETTVVERFQRSGERAVADVVVRVGDEIVTTIEHEAIIRLP